MLMAPLISAVVGFVVTTARCVINGGIYGGTLRFVLVEWRAFLLLAGVDAVGGAVVGAALWIVSPQRIASFSELAVTAPALFWAIIGIAGPIVVSGVMRLFPARSSKDGSAFFYGSPEVALQITMFRKELTGFLYESLAQGSDAWLGDRDDWLILNIKSHAKTNGLTPVKLMRCIDQTVGRLGRQTRTKLSTAPWSDYRAESAFQSTNPLVYADLVERMAWSAIDAKLQNALATSCRIKLNAFSPKVRHPSMTPEPTTSAVSAVFTADGLTELASLDDESLNG